MDLFLSSWNLHGRASELLTNNLYLFEEAVGCVYAVFVLSISGDGQQLTEQIVTKSLTNFQSHK